MRRDGERDKIHHTCYLVYVIDSFKGDLSEIRKSDRRRGEIERGRRTDVHVS